jgi:hypothetical protein
MTEYVIRVAFRLTAFDSVVIEAASDAEALEKAPDAARALMASLAHPEHIDTDERRQGIIAFIDRLTPGGRSVVAEDIAFEGDRINDPPTD